MTTHHTRSEGYVLQYRNLDENEDMWYTSVTHGASARDRDQCLQVADDMNKLWGHLNREYRVVFREMVETVVAKEE